MSEFSLVLPYLSVACSGSWLEMRLDVGLHAWLMSTRHDNNSQEPVGETRDSLVRVPTLEVLLSFLQLLLQLL